MSLLRKVVSTRSGFLHAARTFDRRARGKITTLPSPFSRTAFRPITAPKCHTLQPQNLLLHPPGRLLQNGRTTGGKGGGGGRAAVTCKFVPAIDRSVEMRCVVNDSLISLLPMPTTATSEGVFGSLTPLDKAGVHCVPDWFWLGALEAPPSDPP